ncbi:glycosyltransferase family 39 protein [Siphonobacter sp. SORGH_AS_1065]|uniref:glycosyltransferase family 39 protein n=1 Tax=Siphonobacter sp. SORGH_AS_1065 TaxID=3041795 RepID=UPI00277E103B|nr:glycosyltransferase family 39 protein [Siphonobacter sp. SORGH_AS_1065]MDQ1088831.1 4-amino-4-deoxy-L-arabinose transferase-like glycosyltransferase [Siphonobacter sp. SORGH_AS_1065]
MSRNQLILFLSGILLLAFGLRVYTLGDYSLFFDEKSTLLVSQGVPLEGANQPELHQKYFTPQDFWRPKHMADYYEAINRSDIGNSPAYYVLFHAWVALFGMSDFSVRFLSVIFSVLIVALGFRFTQKHLKSDKLALSVALVLAIEPFFIAYSHQARNYSMTFFFTLLLTDVFLDIVRSPNPVHWTKFLWYGVLAWLVWFCHLLAIIVIAIHGLYVLLYVRNLRTWIGLGLSLLLPIAGMVWWMSPGKGGEYTLHTLKYQGELYNKVAHTQSPEMLATPKNVWSKLAPVLTDQFWITNGLASRLTGKTNFIIWGITTLLSLFALWQYQRFQRFKWSILAIIATLASLFLYKTQPWGFLALQSGFILLGVLIYYGTRRKAASERSLLVLFALLTFVPTAFLVVMTLKNGHTFGITQRYGGFSFPYAIILIAIALRESSKLALWAKVIIVVACVTQFGAIAKMLREIYQDRSPKYTYRSEARIPNPYIKSAELLKKLYMPGDTILYPSGVKDVFGAADEYTYGIKVSVVDAQLINVYLPKDATYWQRIDPAEPDKLYLWQKSTGKKRLIFDFEGAKYRY